MPLQRRIPGGVALFAVLACLAAAPVAYCGVTSDPKDYGWPDAKWVSVTMDADWVTFQIRLTESIFARDGIVGMYLHTSADGAIDIDLDGDAQSGEPSDPGIDLKFTYSVGPAMVHGSLLYTSGPRKGNMEFVGFGGTGPMKISAKDADVFYSLPRTLLDGHPRFRYVLWSGGAVDTMGGDRVPNQGLASSKGDGTKVDVNEPMAPSDNPLTGGLPQSAEQALGLPLPPPPVLILPPPPPGAEPMPPDPGLGTASKRVTIRESNLGGFGLMFEKVTTYTKGNSLVWDVRLGAAGWPGENSQVVLLVDTDQRAGTAVIGPLVRGLSFGADRGVMVPGGQPGSNQKKAVLTGSNGQPEYSLDLAKQTTVTREDNGQRMIIEVPMSVLGISAPTVNWMLANCSLQPGGPVLVFGNCAVRFQDGQAFFADVLNMF